jgi:hypothetical protein
VNHATVNATIDAVRRSETELDRIVSLCGANVAILAGAESQSWRDTDRKSPGDGARSEQRAGRGAL